MDRRDVAERGLTPAAVAHLTRDALGRVDLAALAPLKALLKQFFSDAPWTAGDDEALARLAGDGTGWWSYALDDDIELEFGWRDDSFRLDVHAASPSFDETFDGSVTPEATPNPRTIRFVTGPIHAGPSKWYESVETADDPRVAVLFAVSDDVANVLVGPDFVAVGLRHPDRWERMLAPMLRAVAEQFSTSTPEPGALETATAPPSRSAALPATDDRRGAVERAWRELGGLRADRADDLRRIVEAFSSADAPVRQVAARLLVGADLATAEAAWGHLLDDPSRSVRRATVDAIVDDERQELRPLLERALLDADAWTRWKALRGLVTLGIAPSRAAVEPLASDPDFRVRLEAAGALS